MSEQNNPFFFAGPESWNATKVRWLPCFVIFFLGFGVDCLAQNDSQREVYFQEKIQPILAVKCFSCHGPKVQKSGYRLDVRATALRGGDQGESPIVPGKIEESLLLKYVSDESSEMTMPPKDSLQPRLTAEEVARLNEWIVRGAIWPESASARVDDPLDWWSFKPMHKTPLPNTEPNPIDSFVKSKLSERGLAMSPPADARTLARRLYFDLIGLPPTPEVLDFFESDFGVDAESALDRLVEDLISAQIVPT